MRKMYKNFFYLNLIDKPKLSILKISLKIMRFNHKKLKAKKLD